jgi:diguanylate cyclase (GGDEF)-like protein
VYRKLNEHLEIAIKSANRNQETFTLLMLDLDHFKEVNDALGHSIGDKLLIEVGIRLAGLLRETDTIARFGGDEFAILLPTAHETQASKVAVKIAAALADPFNLGDQQLYTSASIGIASFPQHGHDASTLIQHADIAMYVAKKGTTGWALYDSVQDRHSVGRLGLMAELRNAVSKNSLEIHYQPKRDILTNEIHSAEALLRWNHPEHGYIPPEEIVSLAEQTGFIHELSTWVLENAVKQAGQWIKKGTKLNIAVNLSAHNLQDENIVKHVRELLANTGFPPKQLTLEITENAMMADPEHAVTLLGHLSAMGIRISVDDFGTGFSSLGYLKKLPVDELKIDKSFVTDMVTNDNDAVIVRSTIDLAHNLGLKVVAEGVENNDTMDLLKILRCDTAQGYLISKPIPAKDFEIWLRSQRSEAKLAHHPSSRSAG